MARIVYSGLIDKISGSIGGTCFQSNKYGFTVKRKPNIVRPHTARQQINKTLFSRTVRAWREMTQTGRDNWDTFASTNPQYAKNNPTSQLSGFACFVKWTYYELQRGGNVDTTPDITIPDQDTVSWTLQNNTGVLNLISNWSLEEEAWYAAIFLTRPLLASQKFLGTKPRYVVTTSSVDQTDVITTAYTAIYGTVPSVGDLIGLSYIMFMETGGSVLAAQEEILTVSAP